MKKIKIQGEIVDPNLMGLDGFFYSPSMLDEELASIEDKKEPLYIEITSEGGSVFGGIQIANTLSRWEGKVITHATGLCASIATVILMAGDEVKVDSNAFLLCHLPWTCAEGNANDLQKEIAALEICQKAMMGYYKKHMKVDEAKMNEILAAETWFLGSDFTDVFNVDVVEVENASTNRIAAKLKSKFKNFPKRFIDMTNELTEDEKKKIEEGTNETSSTDDNKVGDETVETSDDEKEVKTEPAEEEEKETSDDEKKASDENEEAPAEPTIDELLIQIEELKKENEELKKQLKDGNDGETADTVSKEECEKRVSGMQASMQKQMNKHNEDFKVQLKAKEDELISARAEITSIQSKLEEATKNCEGLNAKVDELTSALDAKTKALDELNANVNEQATTVSVASKSWRELEGKDFFDYLKKNKGIIKVG